MKKLIELKDFPGYYVTDEGDVYSVNYNRMGFVKKMKPSKDGKGYLFVSLMKNKKRYIKKVHRLVAETFIPNPDNKPQVNHKNGNKTDNNVKNLEFCTCSENCIHKFQTLGYKQIQGKKCPWSKIILQIKDNNVIAEFYGCNEAERETGISNKSIRNCCHNKQKTAGKYEWKFKE